ncbi:RNA 2'-phosphotransferase [Ralstonia nicotianae]|uniref:RNA 2'-phosphotransferase n=1 Tax=Ralstonia pseudosolanacearum TaxID=1310165 RepID=UPI000CE48083|nr:RNA 2'-phosphotransferase [Ralstonia pseudosolanacearum]MBX9432002.1 RNA 2'-phosphotransferase [Ralstonia pseudosolanacearum]
MSLLLLSKTVSYALRHEPWLYELELDDEGWVPVEELLSALRAEKPEWSAVSEADLVEMIARSDKKRHELRDGKIRALYGHSVPNKLSKQPAEPPAILYHGTSPETAQRIKVDGLRPMSRQYAHLSVDKATAEQVGRRKAQMPVLVVVKATQAHAAGIAFYRGNDQVWLADFVPATFIE